MSRSPIACRVYSYAPFLERAHAHIAELGLKYVETVVPSPDELDAVAAELDRHGLRATTLHAECDVQRSDIAAQVAAQMPAFERLGTKLMFVSVRADGTPLDVAYDRLRAAADVAAQHGVTIVAETHPDLFTNAEVAAATFRGVNHSHLRMNYDTANIYFYNDGADAVGELRQIVDQVAAVHLKETDGGYRHWHFPELGAGIVDFPRIFETLDAAGFHGPCTLEIEGLDGEERTESLVCERIAASVEYLKRLGRL